MIKAEQISAVAALKRAEGLRTESDIIFEKELNFLLQKENIMKTLTLKLSISIHLNPKTRVF